MKGLADVQNMRMQIGQKNQKEGQEKTDTNKEKENPEEK